MTRATVVAVPVMPGMVLPQHGHSDALACPHCGRRVWVNYTDAAHVQAGDLDLICTPCHYRAMRLRR